MILFPAIDIYNGRAVRLSGGDYAKVTVYGSPLETARRFEDAGAEWVHVVDLNGADGSGDNFGIIREIATKTKLKVQSGGGLRDKTRVARLLRAGAARAVLGTICASEPSAVGEIIETFGAERVVCGLDARDGKVAIRGWKETADVTPAELGGRLKACGAKYFLFTDVARDGLLSGANIDATAELAQKLGVNVIASGGVKDIGELEEMKRRGIYGAILGKAYYENKIDLKEAIKLCTT